MKIFTNAPAGCTVVQNYFIDQYMPQANGEFVKVYLYLLRCANTGREFSLSSIADALEYTEKDIQRALVYWEKQGLLQLTIGRDAAVTAITFQDPRQAAVQAAGRSVSCKDVSGSEAPQQGLPGGRISPADRATSNASSGMPYASGSVKPASIEKLPTEHDRQNLRQLFFIAEQYLQRPLGSSEQSDFVYYYDTLHFSPDLIEYLLEYCISKGSASRHYMRKVALAWAEAGITTVLQAKQETNLYNKNFFTILNAFGIKGRNPAPPEQELMTRWLNTFGFTLDIILEACRRTICQTHQPNFQYTDKILEQWHKSGVTSLSDIEKLDRKHLKEQKKASQKEQPKSAQNNRFNNFSQREYNYSDLERQLLSQ